MVKSYYLLRTSRFGVFGVVWQDTADGVKVTRICLPGTRDALLAEMSAFFPGAVKRSCPSVSEFADRIQRYLRTHKS